MTTVSVATDAEAARKVAEVMERATDWSSFWDRLDGGPFPRLAAERGGLAEFALQRWDARFGLGWRHAASTIVARNEGLGVSAHEHVRRKFRYREVDAIPQYYEEEQPGARARADFPYLEWTGALRAAASRFTEKTKTRATVDPSANYQGPIEGDAGLSGWDLTRAADLGDEDLWPTAAFDALLEREIEAWSAAELAR